MRALLSATCTVMRVCDVYCETDQSAVIDYKVMHSRIVEDNDFLSST